MPVGHREHCVFFLTKVGAVRMQSRGDSCVLSDYGRRDRAGKMDEEAGSKAQVELQAGTRTREALAPPPSRLLCASLTLLQPSLCLRPGSVNSQNPASCPQERPRLAERDVQSPPTLQLVIRWILPPDRRRRYRTCYYPA